MAVEIKMPQLSDTMSAGKILAWRKKEGDLIRRGDVLAEVETEKANLEIESFFGGTLLKIITPAAGTAKVGEPIAVIGELGESTNLVGTLVDTGTPAVAGSALTPAVTPMTVSVVGGATERAVPVTTVERSSWLPNGHAGEMTALETDGGSRLKVSPLAKKIAQEWNIDLHTLRGSGPAGRIVRKDVEQAAASGDSSHSAPAGQRHAVPASPRNLSPYARDPSTRSDRDAPRPQKLPSTGTLIPLSKMRETIARRMQESVTTAPHFYTTVTIDMRDARKLRAALKNEPEFTGLSMNHFVIKAAAYALEREPRVNFAMRDGQIYQPAEINIGVITALEEGLLIPVIKEANALSLQAIVRETNSAIERARAGRPNSHDLLGGTFSISNMGMFAVENFTAIINPGQGAVLAVSAPFETPVAEAGQIVIGYQMKVTLSVDHRIIDGIMSANFLKFFKRALEVPALLMQ